MVLPFLTSFSPPGHARSWLAGLLGASLSLAGVLEAADAVSPVVGFLKFDCPGGSDTVVSVPFHSVPRWTGRLASAPLVPSAGVMRLEIEGTPGFAPSELTDHPHWVFFRDGSPAEGRHFRVVAHGLNTIDVSASPTDLAGVSPGALVGVVPATTLESLFPPATQTTFHASTGNLASQRGSEALLFDHVSTGTQLAPSRRFFVTAAGWLETGSYAPAAGVLLEPGRPFIVRHRPGVAATTFFATQQVHGDKASLTVRQRQAGPQDTALALPRPVPTKLADLDLSAGVFEESASTAPGDRKDELRIYDNALAAQNKPPLAVYFRVGGQWVKDAAGFPAANNDEVEPSAGLLLRKAAAASDGAVLWVNTPRYDVTAP